MKDKVLAILEQHVGHGKAINADRLGVEGLDWTIFDSNRYIRRIVQELIAEGYPVCSGDDGYYLAETWDELNEMLRKIRKTALALLKKHSNLKKLRPVGEPQQLRLTGNAKADTKRIMDKFNKLIENIKEVNA